jgi:hypothetical protein
MEVFDDRAGFYACSSFAGVGTCQKHLNYNTIEAKECVKTHQFSNSTCQNVEVERIDCGEKYDFKFICMLETAPPGAATAQKCCSSTVTLTEGSRVIFRATGKGENIVFFQKQQTLLDFGMAGPFVKYLNGEFSFSSDFL